MGMDVAALDRLLGATREEVMAAGRVAAGGAGRGARAAEQVARRANGRRPAARGGVRAARGNGRGDRARTRARAHRVGSANPNTAPSPSRPSAQTRPRWRVTMRWTRA